ncbi:hypothetical protein V8C34DRAFT_285421 [Trichoderma compactum]
MRSHRCHRRPRMGGMTGSHSRQHQECCITETHGACTNQLKQSVAVRSAAAIGHQPQAAGLRRSTIHSYHTPPAYHPQPWAYTYQKD